ncbi:MAG: hypothetical protein F6J87_26430 [Spirulina sp. SIO3F2]|nr:hypothetical protein [Spirulina sp. SIO3F2]
MKVIDFQKSYTFSNIFTLNAEIDDLVADFGYALNRTKLNLSHFPGELQNVQEIQEKIEGLLPFVSLTTEMARREILISRVVTEVVYHTQAQLRIEYPLKVSEQLQGNLDYLLKKDQQVVVIEAKNEDFVNGMKQLVVEMIALDQWSESQQDYLLGAITTGNFWQFARLDSAQKTIQQSFENYRFPEDVEDLLRILIQALIG